MKDARKPPFFWIANQVLDAFGKLVGPIGVSVYCALARFASSAREAWPSVQTLAEEVGISKRKAQQTLRHLVQVELIELRPRDPGDRQRTNVYRLIDPPDHALRASTYEPPYREPDAPTRAHPVQGGGAPGSGGGRTGRPGGGAQDAPNLDSGNKTQGEREGNAPPPREGLDPPEDVRRAAAARLARLWADLQTARRHGAPADPACEVIDDLAELLRHGLPQEALYRQLAAPERDRSEYWSAFRDRAKRSLAAYRAHETRRREALQTRARSLGLEAGQAGAGNGAAAGADLVSGIGRGLQ